MRGEFVFRPLLALAAVFLLPLPESKAQTGKLEISVAETAGIRRFGYPVHATLTLPREVTEKDRFRLLSGGKPVPAQFRLLASSAKTVALDFNTNAAPWETKTYQIEYGP